jgi:carbonic anhydrase
MRLLKELFDNNRRWASRTEAEEPGFFDRLVHQQLPQFFWIGCSDSRVPANQITGLMPGEVFVHRNIANLVSHSDVNCLSALQYAVEVLRVRHVLVVGHYGCGGVRAALQPGARSGPLGEWLKPLHDLSERYQDLFHQWHDEELRWDKLCELNVAEQVATASRTRIIRDAWARGQEVAVHGWIYSIHDGLLTDLNLTVTSRDDCDETFRSALSAISNQPFAMRSLAI